MSRKTLEKKNLVHKGLKKEGIVEKRFYERLAYEFVDEKSLSYVMSRETTKKRKWSIKG